MGDFSLEFINPSELDDIKMGLETGIQENERRLTRARITFIDKLELDEFRPSIFEKEMEIIKPCIKRTSKYLKKHNTKQVKDTKRSITCQKSARSNVQKLCEDFTDEYPIELIEKTEAQKVCLGKCIRQVPVNKVDDIHPGDHLVYQRSGYQHHAVVVSVTKIDDDHADITVIHKSGNANDVIYGLLKFVATIGQSSPKGRLMEEKFENVHVRETQLFVVKYQTYPYSPEKIIERARDELKKSKSSEYNLNNNNCEHIVTWCVTGEWYSDQINSLWINVMNKFKPFCEDTPSLEKVEDMKRCELICDKCYSKCKLEKSKSQ